MAITLRSQREIELIRNAGSVVAKVLSKLQEIAEPKVTTADLDRAAERIALDAGAELLFKGVRSPYAEMLFPGCICASVNEQVVHGIPSSKVVLSEGDILSIDFGVRLNGYCGDAAVTFGIGKIDEDKQQLLEITRQALGVAIKLSAPGVKWSDVAAQMQSKVESAGFSVVRDFVGHGIGREMHEEPRVPNFDSRQLRANDIILAEGMVLAVEPMVNAGSCDVRTLKDGWTVATKDGKNSAHFEHTIAIVKNGCEVMTSSV